MNWKTLGILSGVALMAVATPATVNAQRSGGRGAGAMHSSSFGGARMGAASRPAGSTQFANRGSNFNRTAANSSRTGTNTNHNWTHNGEGNWHHDRDGGHDGWRDRHWHNNNYYYYGGGFGYPYYGYPFGFGYPYGYGYGYGYGFGYPYYGGLGVSATFYGDNNRYSSERSYQAGNGSVTARVQQRLAQAGYYRGAIDGVAGSGTRSAIRSYERAHGLPVDGQIDSQLLARMGVS